MKTNQTNMLYFPDGKALIKYQESRIAHMQSKLAKAEKESVRRIWRKRIESAQRDLAYYITKES